MPIRSRAELREHIHWAMSIEMLTIPPYLYALYSIKDPQATSARLIRSIVAEEMLHLALATNLLVAVGGRPRFYDPRFAPSFPVALPHHSPELIIDLAPCSRLIVEDVFMLIEQPKDLVSDAPDDGQYHSLGDFYMELESSVRRLGADEDLFHDPKEAHQLADPAFYAPVEFDAEDSGGLHAITDVDTACRAIETIVHQGEGLRDHHWADPNHQELTHYYKLLEIAEGGAPIGDVWPVATNPRIADFSPPVAAVGRVVNAAYSLLFVTMDALYHSTDSQEKGALIGRLYRLMSGVIPRAARLLVTLPTHQGSEVHAGPTFEFHEFSDTSDPVSELVRLAEAATEEFDELNVLPELLASI